MAFYREKFDKPMHRMEHYTRDKGEHRRVIELNYRDIARFPLKNCSESEEAFGERASLMAGEKTKWFPLELPDYDLQGCLDMVDEKWEFPPDIRRKAERDARLLYDAIVEHAAPRQVRRQEYGRFDSTAMGRVIKDMQAGKFSRQNTRPFTKRQKIAPKRPHVAIISQANPSFMWDNPNNIPNMAAATLAVLWACEALDCEVTAATGFNNIDHKHDPWDEQYGILHDHSTQMALKDYFVLFHADLFRWGESILWHAHEETKACNHYGSGNMCGDNKFYGVEYAKKVKGATMVVALGKFKDADKADVQVKDLTDLDKIIPEIAAKLTKQERMAA